jgi:uncharacterized protein
MSLKQKYGSLALVAGASEGIGEAFSRFLAEAGMDLILVARKKEPLDKLADLLRNEFHVNVDCLVCDLSTDDVTQIISEFLTGREISLLVYNAALSYIGPFERHSALEHKKIAVTNMITPMSLVRNYGETMIKRGKGAVILMASLAGFQGSGYLATYASSKAFTRVLAESLWYEWKTKGVDVLACCAGATSTPNFIRTNPEKKSFFAPRVQSPEEVVRECMKRLGKTPSFIAGRGNRIASFFMQKLLPRKMAINIMGDTTKKMYRL